VIPNGLSKVFFKLIELRDSFKPDHGYSNFSKTFIQLCEIISEFDLVQRRDFLSFCTGSPKLPRGGFKALEPKLTVVRKVAGDECLPSVMTCAHYLKLPEYSDVKFLKKGLLRAISEGKNSFHLS
jgi:E3 ubiquitin-protein ligase TRIP12